MPNEWLFASPGLQLKMFVLLEQIRNKLWWFMMFRGFQLFTFPAKSISVDQIVSIIVPPSISCAIWWKNKYMLYAWNILQQKKRIIPA